MTIDVFDILGKEYKAVYVVYDMGNEILRKGDTFVLLSIDENGLVQVAKTTDNKVGDPFYVDYDSIGGSVPTGRTWDPEKDVFETGPQGEKLPYYFCKN